MTIDILEQYYGIASNIEAINEQIEMTYNTVHSPVSSETHSTEPSDKTKQSALDRAELIDLLEIEMNRQIKIAKEIERWLVTVKDSEVVSIIRWHYLLHYNWKVTNYKVYGYYNYQYARKKVIRWFEKNGE